MSESIPNLIVKTFCEAHKEAITKIKSQISNIRYCQIRHDKGYILFEINGKTQEIPEPEDVILVG